MQDFYLSNANDVDRERLKTFKQPPVHAKLGWYFANEVVKRTLATPCPPPICMQAMHILPVDWWLCCVCGCGCGWEQAYSDKETYVTWSVDMVQDAIDCGKK